MFISYKRQECWTPWTRDHFKKLLQGYLQQDLGRAPEIFVDERITVGSDWVDSLAEHLACSRVLVAIFSADYFGSDWCVHELDLMLERSQAIPHAKADDARLIIPVIVHDGDLIPVPVKRIQPDHLEKYRIAYINESTSDYHDFSKAIRDLSPMVANAVTSAPDFEAKWMDHHKERLNRIFDESEKGRCVLPTKFTLTKPSPPTTPPRPTF
jgi:hypothetical protein